jgi:hypothetical protein
VSLDGVFVFAAFTASRNEQNPSFATASFCVVTVTVAAA